MTRGKKLIQEKNESVKKIVNEDSVTINKGLSSGKF